MRRHLAYLAGCICLAAPLTAQDIARPVPAATALALTERLGLDSSQIVKLRDLEKAQSAALTKSVAALLRAEAEVVETSSGDDFVKRRSALEARSRAALDAELARLKWEKDARAVLKPRQLAELPPERPSSMLWPAPLSAVNLGPAAPSFADSGEVRLTVTPSYADIFVNGEKRGSGRKFLPLPVGAHAVEFAAVGCEPKSVRVEVLKDKPTIVIESLTCK